MFFHEKVLITFQELLMIIHSKLKLSLYDLIITFNILNYYKLLLYLLYLHLNKIILYSWLINML